MGDDIISRSGLYD